MSKKVDILGQRFGRWVVLEAAGRNKYDKALWLCKCDCGNKKIINGCMLRSGESKSCGCLRSTDEIRSQISKTLMGRYRGEDSPHYGKARSKESRNKQSMSRKDRYMGIDNHNYKHGLTGTKEYICYKSAKRRSLKKNQTPPDADINKIQRFYSIASLMNKYSTNCSWHVDHIYPLSRGGLHHQDNLQILEASDNCRKSNKINVLKKIST